MLASNTARTNNTTLLELEMKKKWEEMQGLKNMFTENCLNIREIYKIQNFHLNLLLQNLEVDQLKTLLP